MAGRGGASGLVGGAGLHGLAQAVARVHDSGERARAAGCSDPRFPDSRLEPLAALSLRGGQSLHGCWAATPWPPGSSPAICACQNLGPLPCSLLPILTALILCPSLRPVAQAAFLCTSPPALVDSECPRRGCWGALHSRASGRKQVRFPLSYNFSLGFGQQSAAAPPSSFEGAHSYCCGHGCPGAPGGPLPCRRGNSGSCCSQDRLGDESACGLWALREAHPTSCGPTCCQDPLGGQFPPLTVKGSQPPACSSLPRQSGALDDLWVRVLTLRGPSLGLCPMAATSPLSGTS